ncbi:leucine-rich PPR motif-containing protein, mitochondrial-like [Contarinia nasturtii]|uniref:leucine-rich PPR motif-containing protein, mitochondrial-like n=1 Tax=Contarinia nasturtii TaxID=265458 RepID=UPI0012D48282|nr:leucine-rich PPR motif-containing protein, mitochondrial-like [Contarinia nasturtii]
MLSRFCNPSLKLAHFAYTLNNVNFHRVPQLSYSEQKSNYARSIPGAKYNRPLDLVSLLRDFKVRVENKNPLTQQDLETLVQVIKKQKVDNEQAKEIFKICAHGRIDVSLDKIVFNIWELFKDQKNAFDIHHYNYLLQFAKRKSDCEQMQQFFEEIRANNLKPNFTSYQCLLETYCKAGNMEKAVDILDMMDKDSMHLSERAYNNLIECHIICGDIENANAMMSSLNEQKFKVSYPTLNALLTHYCKSGDWENIQATLEKMKAENMQVASRDILNATCELIANGHADKIDSMIEHVKSSVVLQRSIKNVITTFVEKKQSAILPLIIQKFSTDTESNYKHLIEEMVRLSASSEEFDETIKAIEANGLSFEKHFHIFEPGFESSSEILISKLLNHVKASGKKVSQSLFEKMFEAASKIGPEHVLKLVDLMCGDFKIRPQISFVRDFILPGLNAKEDPIGAYAKLQTTKIYMRSVVMALANVSLNKGDFKTAHDFLISMDGYYNTDIIKRPLIKAFTTTGDVRNFVLLVRVIYDSLVHFDQFIRNENKTTETKDMKKAFAAEMLSAAITQKGYNPELTKSLLLLFVEEGLTITPKAADTIRHQLKDNSESEIDSLLEKLSREELELKPITNVKKSSISRQINSIDLQNILQARISKGHNVASTEKLLFLAYIREGNVKDIEPLLAKGSFSLTNADYAQLINLYTSFGYLENALNTLQRVCENNESFKLDATKVGKLVTLMFKENKNFDEIEAILIAHGPPKCGNRVLIFEKLLENLADNSSQQLVNRLFDTLVKHNYVQPSKQILSPLLYVYLKNDMCADAVEQLEKIADEHKMVPMSMLVFKKLIEQNEIDLLQRAFDVYEKVYNESSALSRLAFAFVDCNRPDQARAIFENEGIKNISQQITRECAKYVERGKIRAAKALLSATRGLYCDRDIIYDSLLSIYIQQNKAHEALELWTEINDEIVPKKSFIEKLYNFLKANDVEIPHDLKPKTIPNQKVDKNKATKLNIRKM